MKLLASAPEANLPICAVVLVILNKPKFAVATLAPFRYNKTCVPVYTTVTCVQLPVYVMLCDMGVNWPIGVDPVPETTAMRGLGVVK